jgi:hypothetical protein
VANRLAPSPAIQSLSSLIPIGNEVIGSANENRIIRQIEQLGLLDNLGRTEFKFSSSLLDTTIQFVTWPAQSLFFLNVLFLAALEPGHFDCQAKHFFAKPLAIVTFAAKPVNALIGPDVLSKLKCPLLVASEMSGFG